MPFTIFLIVLIAGITARTTYKPPFQHLGTCTPLQPGSYATGLPPGFLLKYSCNIFECFWMIESSRTIPLKGDNKGRPLHLNVLLVKPSGIPNKYIE